MRSSEAEAPTEALAEALAEALVGHDHSPEPNGYTVPEMSGSPCTYRRVRLAAAAAMVAALVAGALACGPKQELEPELEAKVGRSAVPYSRKPVTTSSTSAIPELRDPTLDGTGEGLPEPPDMYGTTSRRASSSTTSTTAATTSSDPASSVPSLDAATCTQYAQLLVFIAEVQRLVKVSDPSTLTSDVARLVSENRTGLEQIYGRPFPDVKTQTIDVLDWVSHKARAEPTDDPAFESSLDSLKKWHRSEC